MNKYFDFRSDTVTEPTELMRNKMTNALVGDDVYGDDPTVIQLEKEAANCLGKEAALFVPSGTFGNQLALFTHARRGSEVLLGHDCHIMMHEVGAASVIAGVQLRQVTTDNGTMPMKTLESMIRTDDIHFPETGLICMENAHSNGSVVSIANMKQVYTCAQKHHIPVHLDGARLFNAALTLEVDVKEIAAYADSIMFCLSKGLCAPMGSMLVGSKAFIEKARKKRKLMGGGLRQVGIVAAAGLVALQEMPQYLKTDHDNAKYLAEKLSEIDQIEVEDNRLDINMVFCKIKMDLSDSAFVEALYQNGIKINGPENGEYRFVTHYWTPKEAVDKLVRQIKTLI